MPSGLKQGPLVAAAQTLRIQGLRRIDAALSNHDPKDRPSFVDALGALLVLDVDAASIARKTGIATATVTRWSQGFHSPHHLVLPAVVLAMRSVIADEIAAAGNFVSKSALKAA